MKRLIQLCKTLGARCFTFGRVAGVLSLLALATICFVAGAATLYFDLPLSRYFLKAFSGSQTWFGQDQDRRAEVDGSDAQVTTEATKDSYDGYTLFTTTDRAGATLIDMRGNVVHQWTMSFRRTWPTVAHVRDPDGSEPIHWERCHLYPNGDVLAMCCSGDGSPYGYGLAKFDKNSRLLWGCSANVHHDVTVGEDGRIYVLTDRFNADTPGDLNQWPGGYTADDVLVLSPEGRELDRIPILEAFRNSPYYLVFVAGSGSTGTDSFLPHAPQPPGAPPGPPRNLPPMRELEQRAGSQPRRHAEPGDLLHTNSVKYLSQTLAQRFPLFKAGQLLISLRSPSLIAVLDTQSRSIVWAATGAWKMQHDAQFLENGHLLLFDNLGSPRSSRVLEVDPVTQAITWSYASNGAAPFTALFRGAAQRLPNGNTLIVDLVPRNVLEVTPRKEIVWSWDWIPNSTNGQAPGSEARDVTGARRYGADELTFLKEKPNVRPR
jgi:hypothetical protein